MSNVAKNEGGAVRSTRLITSVNTTYINNTADKGGAIYSQLVSGGTGITSIGDVIYNNHATSYADDIYSYGPTTLPDAADFNATYQNTGKMIDGWYDDSS